MSDVFLSHNSADKPAVKALAHRLRQQEGIEPWLDEWNLIPGQPWQADIEQALQECKACAVFISPSGFGPWQHEEMRIAITRRVGQRDGFAVIPVLLPGAERGAYSQYPAFLTQTTWVEFHNTLNDAEAFRRLVCGIRRIAPGPSAEEAIDPSVCPYRGLEFFDIQHAPLFFGRAALVDWLLDSIRPRTAPARSNRFLALVGASGSGKSSLARAGLLARLKQGALPGSEDWPLLIVRPYDKPLESLALALCKDESLLAAAKSLCGDTKDKTLSSQIVTTFKQASSLHHICRLASHGLPDSRRVLVLIDQFEEIFSLCDDADERRAFIDNLVHAATDSIGPAIVVLTLRDDYYGKCAPYPALAALLASDSQFLIGPMTEVGLREAITAPALRVGCEVEAGLAEVLLQEVEDQPGRLPLLQFALRLLWDKRQSRLIRLADYRTLGADGNGGLEAALREYADGIYQAFLPGQQAVCRQILLRLVQPGEGTGDSRRHARLDEFGDGKDAREVLKTLADTRLVTTGAGQAEVSHEALIREWPLLRGWIEEDRDALKTQHQITKAAQDWDENPMNPAWLWVGSRLQAAEEWLEKHGEQAAASALERAFIQAGVEQRDREAQEKEAQRQRELDAARRRTFLARLLAGVTLLGLLIASGLAWWGNSERLQRTASLFDSLLTHAAMQAKIEDYAAARELLKQSRELDRDVLPQRRHARDLLAGFVNLIGGEAEYTYAGAGVPLVDVAISPDGRWLAASGERGTIVLFDRESGKLVQRLAGHRAEGNAQQTAVFDIIFDLRQSSLYSGGADGQIIRWSLPQDGSPARLERQWQTGSGVLSLALGPEGSLASGHADGVIRLWDAASGKLIRELPGHSRAIASGSGLAFSPDGAELASASYDRTARLWDWRVGKTQTILQGHSAQTIGVAYSPDGRWLATASADQTVILWDAKTGHKQHLLKGHHNMVVGLRFVTASSAALLASASFDKTIRLWDVDTGVSVAILQGHTAGVIGLSLWPDVATDGAPRQLFSASVDGTVKRWNLAMPGQVLQDLPAAATSAAVSPDGRFVVVGLENGMIEIYAIHPASSPGLDGSAASRLELRLAQQIRDAHSQFVDRIAFSPDGTRLASGSDDGTVKLWQFQADGSLALQQTYAHQDLVHAVAFSPDGKRLATASYDGQIGLFDLTSGKHTLFAAHVGKVAAVAFAADGKTLLSAGLEDKSLKRWNLATDPPSLIEPALPPAADMLLWASVSPDGRLATAVGREGAVTLHALPTGGEPLRLFGHENTVYKAIFSPDSHQLATVSMDMTVRLWDLDARRELYSLRLPTQLPADNDPPLWDFDFRCTPTGCWIAVPLVSGKLALYNLGQIGYEP